MAPGNSIDEQYRRYLKSKEPRDLAPIFQALAPKLLSAARRAGLDGQGAEDVVQETFLAVIEGEDRFDADRSFVAWVRGIALRQMRAERRRRARLNSLLRSKKRAEPIDVEDPAGFESPLSETEFRRKVDEAIGTLSERNQEVVSAAVIDGLSIDEISNRLDLSKGAVSVRLHRGLARLRKRLEETSALGLVAMGSRSGQGLDGVWERLAEGRPRELATKSAGGGISALTVSVVGGTLLAAFGLAVWIAPDRQGGGADGAVEAVAPPEVAAAEEQSPKLPSIANGKVDPTSPDPNDAQRESLPEPKASEPQGRLRGVVLALGTQEGVPGVEIFLLESDPDIVLPTAEMVPVATTDSDGAYWLKTTDLEPDPTPVLLARRGDEVGWVDVPIESQETGVLPGMSLVPELVIAVTVRDELGQPVEGASLSGWSQSDRFLLRPKAGGRESGFIPTRRYRYLFGGVTDANGEGQIRGLYGADTPGLVAVCSAWKDDYAYAMVARASPGGRRVEMEVTLYATENLSLRGRLEDAEGSPLSGVSVAFVVQGESDVADSKPLTTGPGGEWEAPRELLDDYPLILEFSADGFAGRRHLIEQPDELPDGPLVVALSAAKTLSGRVVDEASEPIAGASIRVAVAGDFYDLTTGTDGSFKSDPIAKVPALVTVAAGGGGTTRRVAAFPVDGLENDVRLVLRRPAGYVRSLTTQLPESLRGENWSRAELFAMDVVGFEGPLAPERIDGSEATFQNVPTGRWLVYGLTGSGAQVLQTLDVEVGASVEETLTVALDDAPPAGGLECIVGEPPGAAPGDCIVFARHTELPRVPAWMQTVAGGLRRELRRKADVGSPISIVNLEPGRWEVSVSGQGWRTETQIVVIEPGQTDRLDFQPKPAGIVELTGAPVSSSGLMTLFVRKNADEPWSQVGLDAVTMGVPTQLSAQLPGGEWSWRVTLQTMGPGGEFVDMTPPTYGEVTVRTGERSEVDFSGGRPFSAGGQ